MIAFLDSKDAIPKEALEQEMLNYRDNLKLAQDHANKTKRNPNWVAVERQLKLMEKHVEHYTNLALQHWGARVGITLKREEKMKERPIVLRKRRERKKAESNWTLFYWNFNKNHALPNLIWNHKVNIIVFKKMFVNFSFMFIFPELIDPRRITKCLRSGNQELFV